MLVVVHWLELINNIDSDIFDRVTKIFCESTELVPRSDHTLLNYIEYGLIFIVWGLCFFYYKLQKEYSVTPLRLNYLSLLRILAVNIFWYGINYFYFVGQFLHQLSAQLFTFYTILCNYNKWLPRLIYACDTISISLSEVINGFLVLPLIWGVSVIISNFIAQHGSDSTMTFEEERRWAQTIPEFGEGFSFLKVLIFNEYFCITFMIGIILLLALISAVIVNKINKSNRR